MDAVAASPRQRALADALAGVSASLAALWIFYPLDVWKTRLQGSRHDDDHDNHSKSTKLPRQEQSSLLETTELLFAGWQCKTLHTATSSFCYFYIYSFLYASAKQARQRQQAVGERRDDHLNVSTRLLLGMAAAALNTFLTLPLDVIASQRQALPDDDLGGDSDNDDDQELVLVEDDSDKDGHDRIRNDDSTGSPPSSALRQIRDRLAPYWKGLWPSLLLCSNPAIHYTVFDSLKYRLLKRKRQISTPSNGLSMVEAFVLGIMAKFVATMATYPLIRAKVVLMLMKQTKESSGPTDNASGSSANGLLTLLQQDYRQYGIASLYRGLSLQLAHTLLKSALLMMVRERINRTTRRLLLSDQSSAIAEQSS